MLSPVHPGEILNGELEELDLSVSELARKIDVPTNRLSQIIRGQRRVTADTALRLGRWFGTGAQFWMNLQSNFDLACAADELGDHINKIEPLHATEAAA